MSDGLVLDVSERLQLVSPWVSTKAYLSGLVTW